MILTLYDELEVSQVASAETISAAFKSLSKRFHPDVCSIPSAKERYSKITNAYNVLSDQQKRKEYDEQLLFEAARSAYSSNQSQSSQSPNAESQSSPNMDAHIAAVSDLGFRLFQAHVVSRVPATYQAAFPLFEGDIKSLIENGIRRMVN
jgi:DnaJ-class molecular chaperone